MKPLNVIDALSNNDGTFDAICEIPYKLARHLSITDDGSVATADIIRIAYWNACQLDLEAQSVSEHLDLVDNIFNSTIPLSHAQRDNLQGLDSHT